MSKTPQPDAEARTAALLAQLWQRNLPVVRERLQLLKRAAAGAAADPVLRAEANAVAHKLAGSLGMFGYAEGSRLAAELERELERPQPRPAKLHTLVEALRSSLAMPTDDA